MEPTPVSTAEQERSARSRFERRSALLAAALLLVGLPFGALLHQVVIDGPLTGLDERAAAWLHARVAEQDLVVAIMKVVSLLGSSAFLVPAVGASVLWLLRRDHRRLAVFLVTVPLGGAVISTVTKVVVGRPRPELDEPLDTAFGYSFPSGHSMGSIVCFGALLVVFLPFVPVARRRSAVLLTIALVLAIGVSRLVLGVHFLSDVLGGFVLGAAWLTGSVALFQTWREERGRRPADVLSEGLEPEV